MKMSKTHHNVYGNTHDDEDEDSLEIWKISTSRKKNSFRLNEKNGWKKVIIWIYVGF